MPQVPQGGHGHTVPIGAEHGELGATAQGGQDGISSCESVISNS